MMSAVKPAQPVSPQVKDLLPTDFMLGMVVGWPPSLTPPTGRGLGGIIPQKLWQKRELKISTTTETSR